MNYIENKKLNKADVVFISTLPYQMDFFLSKHIALLEESHSVVLLTNTSSVGEDVTLDKKYVHVDIERRPSIYSDIKLFIILVKKIKKLNPSYCYTITPKAGLIGSLAAYVAGVENRVHFYTGQVWANKRGFGRRFYRLMDRVIGRCTTNQLVDSPSQRDFLIENKVVNSSDSVVIGEGSIAGVDIVRFNSSKNSNREKFRRMLPDYSNSFVVLYLGRLNIDKGLRDLVSAFAKLSFRKFDKNVELLLVGPDEGESKKLLELAENYGISSQVRIFDEGTKEPELFFAGADLFCLPSYREGFGSVIIEAAASGLASVGSDIYGVRDAIVDGSTGILFEPGNVDDLASKLELLIQNDCLRIQYGNVAMGRACEYYSSKYVIDRFGEFHYMLSKKSR